MSNTIFCSFCGKSNHEVIAMVAATSARICNYCVDVCVPIVEEAKIKFELAKRGSRLMEAADLGI